MHRNFSGMFIYIINENNHKKNFLRERELNVLFNHKIIIY